MFFLSKVELIIDVAIQNTCYLGGVSEESAREDMCIAALYPQTKGIISLISVYRDLGFRVKYTISLLAQLEILSRRCHVFVGTFSSNLSRLVVKLRTANGSHPETTFKVDDFIWDPARRKGRRKISLVHD